MVAQKVLLPDISADHLILYVRFRRERTPISLTQILLILHINHLLLFLLLPHFSSLSNPHPNHSANWIVKGQVFCRLSEFLPTVISQQILAQPRLICVFFFAGDATAAGPFWLH